jgi:hypothetical protein
LNAEAADALLGDATRVLLAPRAEDGAILLAPASERHLLRFNPAHCEALVKQRNAQGDRAIALHELFADHGTRADGPLAVETDEALGLVILHPIAREGM